MASSQMRPTFEGKVALVTGGARGLGRAVAMGFAREGGGVGIADVDEVAALDTASCIRELGRRYRVIAADISPTGAADTSGGQTWTELGRRDIVVNNAAVASVEL